MQVLAVEGVLQELYNIVSDGMLRREAFRPSQNFPLVERGLLDWKGEGEAKIDDLRVIVGFRWVWRLSAGYVRACGRLGVGGEEGIDGIRQVVFFAHMSVNGEGGTKNRVPKRSVASPVFKASETLYFCCVRSNVRSPFKTTSQTRLIGNLAEREGKES